MHMQWPSAGRDDRMLGPISQLANIAMPGLFGQLLQPIRVQCNLG